MQGRTVWGINTSDEGTFHSSSEHPEVRAEYSSDWRIISNWNGAQLQNPPSNRSMCNHVVWRKIRLNLERSMRIGTQSEICLWAKGDRGDAVRCQGMNVLWGSIRYHIEVS